MRNDMTEDISAHLNHLASTEAMGVSALKFAQRLMQNLGDRAVGEISSSKLGVEFHFLSLPDDKGEVEMFTAYWNGERNEWFCKI
jgi:hypothetical protein